MFHDKYWLGMPSQEEWKALKSELATTKADLERAREEADGAWKLVEQYKEANKANLQGMFRGPGDPDPAGCQCRTCATDRGGITLERSRMRVCPECGYKRCPKAEHHVNQCRAALAPAQGCVTLNPGYPRWGPR